MTGLVIKELTSIRELEEASNLEREVWGMPPIPIHQTLTALHNGGISLGAYDREQMVGFLYSFPGFRNGKVYLCSHMMGVHPTIQKQKIGEKLKWRQREVAIQKGYSSITWTFDPLLSINAYLNLHKLGARATRYIENHYGTMSGLLNADLPSDRFQVQWDLASRSVPQRQCIDGPLTDVLLRTQTGSDGLPVILEDVGFTLTDRDCWFLPIPRDFLKIKSNDLTLALDWRMRTRKKFRELIAAGFTAVDLIRTDGQVNYYVFVMSDSRRDDI